FSGCCLPHPWPTAGVACQCVPHPGALLYPGRGWRWHTGYHTLIVILVLIMGVHRLDAAIEPVPLVSGASREEQDIRGLIEQAVAKTQAPEPINDQRVAMQRAHLAYKVAGGHIKGIDASIPKVAHQQPITETAKARGGEREAPRRVERAP